eukprot:2954547-Prymnesium_polylepis.1
MIQLRGRSGGGLVRLPRDSRGEHSTCPAHGRMCVRATPNRLQSVPHVAQAKSSADGAGARGQGAGQAAARADVTWVAVRTSINKASAPARPRVRASRPSARVIMVT